MNKYDLTGQKFGRWTVLEKDLNYRKEHNLKNQETYWKCQCECGTIKTIVRGNLINGKSKSCGCLRREQFQSRSTIKIGDRFGSLIVLERDINFYNNKNTTRHKSAYRCQCDCGQIVSIIGDSLLQGLTKSCGCLNKKKLSELSFRDLTGQRFGKLKVIKFLEMIDHKSTFLCLCDCGREKIVFGKELSSGHTKSCGCLVSNGENKIKEILEENNFSFQEQKTFDTCLSPRTGSKLRFDFYIQNSFLLEFDGLQHFKATSGWNDEKNYEKIKEYDVYKNNWCKENNIPLKRIPYWKIDTLTLEDIMGDEYLI